MRFFFGILLIFSIFFSSTIEAQELNCSVQINTQQISGTQKRIFETLQTAIENFMNTRRWTKDQFTIEERIDCSLLIIITEASGGVFKGTFQVQSRRPVFNSSYNSTMLSYIDNDFSFEFQEFSQLEFNQTQFLSNLTSVLAYYAYMVIGLDYDSFSLYGGTPYFQLAQQIVANAQNQSYNGWKSAEKGKNRYWMVENLLNPQFQPLRECAYIYHIKGMDVLADNYEGGRLELYNAVKLLEKVHSAKPLSFNMQLFFNAKAEEIVNAFLDYKEVEKADLMKTLLQINPANSEKYNRLK